MTASALHPHPPRFDPAPTAYRGRLAPSPTGLLHLGHARTFWAAQERAQSARGILVLRSEDLDRTRCKSRFAAAMFEDLRWFGFHWQEGPDVGGPFARYQQSERLSLYREAFERLRASGHVYPCTCSRKDIVNALSAPHANDEEPIYPGTCRPSNRSVTSVPTAGDPTRPRLALGHHPLPVVPRSSPPKSSWRFRVPDGERIEFVDGGTGPQRFVAGEDFGDFVVWRHDGMPAYQLACVVDDAAMRITEVVRGADLLVSTARQLLLYSALEWVPPKFFHCPLVTDERGVRLAKRHDALSLGSLRAQGQRPEDLRLTWAAAVALARDRKSLDDAQALREFHLDLTATPRCPAKGNAG